MGDQMRTFHRLCRYCGELHQLDAWPHNCLPPAPNRSELAAPSVINGALADVRNPINGQIYTCKRTYERDVRAAGCVIMGNESAGKTRVPPPEISEADVVGDIKRTLEELKTDNLSDIELANMQRAPAPVVDGFTVA